MKTLTIKPQLLGAAFFVLLPSAVYAQTSGADLLRGNVSTVEVTSLTQNAQKPLHAGDVLRVTLTGTAGGKATFTVPGVTEDLPMRETSSGVYTGAYTILKSDSAVKAAVLGKLLANGVLSTLNEAPGTVTIDSQPPKIIDYSPAQNTAIEGNTPLIYASLSDGTGTGVNPGATHLLLDGHDVTSGADTSSSLFTYKPDTTLASGLHVVSLTVSDNAGNTATAAWSFKVAATQIVRSFITNEPAGKAIGSGSAIVFILNATPGGKARATIGSIAKDIPLKESDPGVYTGEYTVKPGDKLENAPVTARFSDRDGTVILKNLASNLILAAGPAPAPRILLPRDSDYVDATAPLTVRGRALPGSTVRVTVSYTSKASGGILPVSGQLGAKDVTVDKNGEWEASGLPLQIKLLMAANRDTVLSVSATQVDAGGNPAANSATIQVRPG